MVHKIKRCPCTVTIDVHAARTCTLLKATSGVFVFTYLTYLVYLTYIPPPTVSFQIISHTAAKFVHSLSFMWEGVSQWKAKHKDVRGVGFRPIPKIKYWQLTFQQNPIRVMCYVPYHFCKTCHVMFALHVYDLTLILGVRWDSGGATGEETAKPVTPIRECISRFHKRDAARYFEGVLKNRHFKPIYNISVPKPNHSIVLSRQKKFRIMWLNAMIINKVMFESCILDAFCWIVWHSSPLSEVSSHLLPKVLAMGDQRKQTFTLTKITDFFGSKHCWKHLG